MVSPCVPHSWTPPGLSSHFPEQPNAHKVDCFSLWLLVNKIATICKGFIQVPCSEQKDTEGDTGWLSLACHPRAHQQGPRGHRPFAMDELLKSLIRSWLWGSTAQEGTRRPGSASDSLSLSLWASVSLSVLRAGIMALGLCKSLLRYFGGKHCDVPKLLQILSP